MNVVLIKCLTKNNEIIKNILKILALLNKVKF